MKSNKSLHYYLIWLTLFLMIIYCIFVIVTASTPPISRDAIIHHLAIPNLYVQHGGIYEIPDIEFSYYPQLIDLLYCIPLWFNNDIIPKYIHFSFALLTALIIFIFLKQQVGKLWALFASLFFLTIPVITKLSVNVYIDLGLIFFSTASLLAIIHWLKNPQQLKWLILSGVSCGLALSSKYTGLIPLLILSLIIPYYYTKIVSNNLSGQTKSLGYSAVFIIISLVIFSPWMIKNTIWTGNPVYPLYNSYFSDTPIQTGLSKDREEITKGIGHFQRRKLIYNESWWETWSIPLRVFFQGQDDTPQFFDGRLNPFLLLLPLLLLFGWREKKESYENQILLVFSIFFILLVFFKTDMRARYIAPVLPALVILSTKGLYSLSSYLKNNKASTPIRHLILLIISFSVLLLNAHYFKGLISKIEPMSYISGKLSKEEYLIKHLPDFATINQANKILPKNSQILAVHLRYRSYYFERKVDFSTHLLKSAIKEANNSIDIYHQLKSKQFTHLIMRFDLFEEWLKFQEPEQRNLTEQFFYQNTQLLFSKNGYVLLQILKNRVATGFSPTAPTPPIMRVRNGRFTNRN
ncbi:MAG: glycosyltransferase family 39 protein, partial [gamma proteobacterium symbiont of Lucinoma myriamae]|nr:glycosyltransferase family 39 protein [gamma proteobacterium symbiont of Lucinoma myriamae]